MKKQPKKQDFEVTLIRGDLKEFKWIFKNMTLAKAKSIMKDYVETHCWSHCVYAITPI